MNDLKLQVVCITYNHEKYIAETLDSFIAQKTTFPFEVLVGDDCSSDGTVAIVEDYANRYPDIIKYVRREQHMGQRRNLMDLCRRCTASYIALCRGDDYWTDESKLQKQFEYMEAHPEAGACFTKTKILNVSEWEILNSYNPVDGSILIPDSLPGYQLKSVYFAHEMVDIMPAHTSSCLFRWNYDLEMPEWFYDCKAGDFALFMMQLGRRPAGFLPDIAAAARSSTINGCAKSESSAHFIHMMYELYNFFKDNYNSYACDEIKFSMKKAFINIFDVCNKRNTYELLFYTINKYPDSSNFILSEFKKTLSNHEYKIKFYGEKEYNMLHTEKKLMTFIKCILKIYVFLKKQCTNIYRYFTGYVIFNEKYYLEHNPDVAAAGINPRRHYLSHGWKERRHACDPSLSPFSATQSILWYWLGALVPKKKNCWVFSSFHKRGYLDNSKYLYEYVVKKYPEIQAVWLTCDEAVLQSLQNRGMPAMHMKTWHARWIMLRAQLAFIDHYVRSDYENRYGFNAATKVVQLWHGVGLKNMTPNGDKIPSIVVPGVQLSSDLLPSPADDKKTRLKKAWRYIFKAPFRELEEKYYAFLCPGQEHVKFLVEPWRISKKACIFSGHPRNINLHSSPKPEKVSIIYSPTFRWHSDDEAGMIDNFLSSIADIDAFLEKVDGTLVLRLHPHTWRHYQETILPCIAGHERISMDMNKDAYATLGSYSIMISDYSSIAFDFVLLDRPIIFLVPDRETFMQNDVSFNYPFDDFTPGPKVRTWKEVIAELNEYVKNPEKDGEWRRKVRAEFYDMSVNDVDNSKRIVEELKRRLGIR